jgi:hypothetical protein
MSDQQIKNTLDNLVNVVASNKSILVDVKIDNATTIELLNTIYQRVEDMSKKFDEVLNTGIKKPKVVTSKKEPKAVDPKVTSTPRKKTAVKIKASDAKSSNTVAPPKVINNIMTFFKTRYIEDSSIFDGILEENQAESVFAEHASAIKNKKKGAQRDNAKAMFLYKVMNDEQKQKIRQKMTDEHDAANVNNDDDIEEESSTD